YAMYTYPGNLLSSDEYTFNDYLCDIFSNIKRFLKNDGRIIINFRDFTNLKKKAKRERFFNYLKGKSNKYTDWVKVIKTNKNHKIEYEWRIARSLNKYNKRHNAYIFFCNQNTVISRAEFDYHRSEE